MNNSIIYRTHDIDLLIHNELKEDIECINHYNFEGAVYNEINFKRLLIFYDQDLFIKANLEMEQLNRWINAYYWYSVYLRELQTQKISIENHRQPRLKLIEQINNFCSPDFDWSIIEKMDNELNMK